MKQLLLITAISFISATQVFAGSSCKTCPTAPAQNSTQADVKDVNKDADTDVVKEPLASNASSTTSVDEDQTPVVPNDQPETQIQPKFLLASSSNSSSSTSDTSESAELPASNSNSETPAQLFA